MSPLVHVHTLFPRNSTQTHGGVRRTQQLVELLESNGIDPMGADDRVEAAPEAMPKRIVSLAKTLPGMQRVRSQIKARRLDRALARFDEPGYLLWDGTVDLFAPAIAKRHGWAVIAAPHNIEALVPNGTLPDRLAALAEEVSAYGRAEAVFCISREETWLLRTLGLPAHFLPYYPPAQVREELLEIRANRASQPSGPRWLMLGTATNAPTRRGMEEGLAWASKLAKTHELAIDVAGYGTETLGAGSFPSSFRFHGAVSREDLRQLMLKARGIMIHQRPTSGSLTRLVEFAMAGIPVIANADATKGERLPWLGTYDGIDELAVRLAEPPRTPSVPERPERDERRFVEVFRQPLNARRPHVALG